VGLAVFERPKGGERAILVQMTLPDMDAEMALAEFRELAQSADAEILSVVQGTRDKPDAKYYVGTGKADEIRDQVMDYEAELVLVNHELSPSQERNLERLFKCRVVDRSGLNFVAAKGSRGGTSTFESNDSFTEALHTEQVPENLSSLVTPSVLMASTLIDVMSNPKKGLDRNAVVNLSKGTISNSRTLLQETLFTGANNLIEGTGLSVGVGAALGLLKEYEYHHNNASLEGKLATTMNTAEASYLELHQMYAAVSQHYQQTLGYLNSKTPMHLHTKLRWRNG